MAFRWLGLGTQHFFFSWFVSVFLYKKNPIKPIASCKHRWANAACHRLLGPAMFCSSIDKRKSLGGSAGQAWHCEIWAVGGEGHIFTGSQRGLSISVSKTPRARSPLTQTPHEALQTLLATSCFQKFERCQSMLNVPLMEQLQVSSAIRLDWTRGEPSTIIHANGCRAAK